MKQRGELIEHTFAHSYETGAMRRTHLRGHENIAKRLLVHVGGFNLSLILRKLIGLGKPRRLQGLAAGVGGLLTSILRVLDALWMVVAARKSDEAELARQNRSATRFACAA